MKAEKKECKQCIKREREHVEHLCKIGERINHLEENILELVDLLDESQLRKFVVKTIIV